MNTDEFVERMKKRLPVTGLESVDPDQSFRMWRALHARPGFTFPVKSFVIAVALGVIGILFFVR